MIEDVEEFRTELEILVFQERGALQEREVHIVEAWTDERMSSCVPVDAENRIGERTWIEPQLGCTKARTRRD